MASQAEAGAVAGGPGDGSHAGDHAHDVAGPTEEIDPAKLVE
jgi:hypothetical protein